MGSIPTTKMKIPAHIKLAVFLVSLIALFPGAAQAGESRIAVDAGLVSASFSAASASDVFDAIRRVTGIEIVAPPSASGRVVTLAVERMPLEAFLRQVLDAVGLGGFMLGSSEPGGAVDRVIVFEKGHDVLVAAPTRGPAQERPGAAARPAVSVPFLINRRDAESMHLGAPGALVVVQAPSLGTARTRGCGGTSDEYPVQSVLVTTATNTYVTSIVVCRPEALGLGQTLNLAPAPAIEPSAGYSSFTGTSR